MFGIFKSAKNVSSDMKLLQELRDKLRLHGVEFSDFPEPLEKLIVASVKNTTSKEGNVNDIFVVFCYALLKGNQFGLSDDAIAYWESEMSSAIKGAALGDTQQIYDDYTFRCV